MTIATLPVLRPNRMKETLLGIGDCPLGGDHRVQWWFDKRGVACYRCHQTWLKTPTGWSATYS